jgi:hypothetical protein
VADNLMWVVDPKTTSALPATPPSEAIFTGGLRKIPSRREEAERLSGWDPHSD